MVNSSDKIFVSPSIPKGLIEVCNIFPPTLVSSELADRVRDSITHSLDICLPFFVYGGIIGTYTEILELGLSESTLSAELIERVKKEYLVELTWKQIISDIQNKSHPILISSHNHKYSLATPGLFNMVRPEYRRPKNLSKEIDANLFLGAFNIHLPNDRVINHQPSAGQVFIVWMGYRIYYDLIKLDSSVEKLFKRNGYGTKTAPQKIASAMLFDICVNNGSINLEQIIT